MEPRGKNQLEQVKRHNIKTEEMKLMVRNHQKFQIFFIQHSEYSNFGWTAYTKLARNNCNHSKLLKENSLGETPNKQSQINYKSTCDNKHETTRAKSTIKWKVPQSS